MVLIGGMSLAIKEVTSSRSVQAITEKTLDFPRFGNEIRNSVPDSVPGRKGRREIRKISL